MRTIRFVMFILLILSTTPALFAQTKKFKRKEIGK